MIPASHTPTPAQQNPDVRRPLAPTLPPPDPNAPTDPVAALNARQKAAIASRVDGYGRDSVAQAGVDGAATPPKPSTKATFGKPAAAASSPARAAAAPGASDSKPTGASSKTSSPTSPSAATPASSPPTKGSEPSTADGAEASAASSSDGSTPSAPAAPAAPAWDDLKGFKRWAEQNPEKALAFAAQVKIDVFREGEDPKNEWIRQTNRGRKLKDEIRAQRAEAERIAEEGQTKAREQLELAEKTAGQLRYLSDMWGAFNGKDANGNRVIDFDTADEAFRQNSGGLTIDEYSRLRARRGVSNPELAKEKAERRRLELELQRLNGATKALPEVAAASAPGAAQGAPEAVKPAAAPAAPSRDPEAFWGDEVPKTHPLRKFAGWAKDLDLAMQQFHDDVMDEYSRDAEEVANDLVKRKLAELRGDEDEPEKVVVTTHARARPKTPKNRGERRAMPESEAPPTNVPGLGIPAHKLVPRGAVNTDRSHREGHYMGSEPPGAMSTAKAVERARLRARGIDPDTGEAWGG